MDRLITRFPAHLLAAATCAAGIAAFSPVAAEPNDEAPSYMPAIRQELARLDIAANCDDATGTCFFTRKIDAAQRTVDVGLRYCRTTDTVYVYIERFVELTDPNGPSLELARQLLALNRRMVTAKLEWDRPTNSIRLSVVINTDSNFDRRAFRSQLAGLWANAERLSAELGSAAAPAGGD